MSGNPSDLEARIRRLERLASGTDRRVKGIEDALSLAGPMIRTIGRVIGGSTPVESGPSPGGVCVACDVPATFTALDVLTSTEHAMTAGDWFVGAIACEAPDYGWHSNALYYDRSGTSLWWRYFICCPSGGGAGTAYRYGFSTEAQANNPTTSAVGRSGALSINSCSPLDLSCNPTAGGISAFGTIEFYE